MAKKKAQDKKGGSKQEAGVAKQPERLAKSDYNELIEPMQLELNNVANWLQKTGQRLVVLFEGRDTAGKGGVIAAIADTLNPRQCRIAALPKPSEREATQWYFQRYAAQLPSAGEMLLFDRSWYNRAGVERVMGFCSEQQARQFLLQAPVFEKMLVDDGVLLPKYWLTVDQVEQERRFQERLDDPLKRWKLSPIDLEARARYADYGQARDQMLAATHTSYAPWTLVDFNDQRLGRLTLIDDLLRRLPDTHVKPPKIEWKPLRKPPLRERFDGPLGPIPAYAPALKLIASGGP